MLRKQHLNKQGNNINVFLNMGVVERALDSWSRFVRDKHERRGKHLDIPPISIVGELYKFGHVIRGQGAKVSPDNQSAMHMEQQIACLRRCFPNLADVLEIEYIHANKAEPWNHKRKAQLAGISTTKYYELLFAAKVWLHGVLFTHD